MTGPPWTAPYGAELQPKLQPGTLPLGTLLVIYCFQGRFGAFEPRLPGRAVIRFPPERPLVTEDSRSFWHGCGTTTGTIVLGWPSLGYEKERSRFPCLTWSLEAHASLGHRYWRPLVWRLESLVDAVGHVLSSLVHKAVHKRFQLRPG